ncbi:MAG: ATP-grasp domain-containing protein [Leptolyngbyaceae cyanobacterium bins.59]|nr:ATP-grasp domain-containing protein [Leptolyngbyaceae cyanobacterium bins.59]
MDLLEYQAKVLFQEMGIPTLPSQQIAQPKELKGLKIPYPVVLKSQVRRGGRSRAGGIRFVENTIDAIAAAQIIFNLPILGESPEVVLAEARYDAEREFYLAVALDSSVRRPVLLGSQQGGVGVEKAIDQMHQVIVDQEFSPFYARRLALKMGLQGVLIESISQVVEKMYRLFLLKDLDLVEINPLGINAKGDVMALDGKVTVNDSALGRHSELASLVSKRIDNLKTPFRCMNLDGNIGIICSGAGLTMTTVDLLYNAGGKPAHFLNIGGEFHPTWPPITLQERLTQGIKQLADQPRIRVILLNLLSGVMTLAELTQLVQDCLPRPWLTAPESPGVPRLVVRLLGKGSALAQETAVPDATNLYITDRLDDAIDQAVKLARA